MAGRAYLELVERVVFVLEALGAGAATLGEIAARSGLPKSTTCRVLYTLRELGWVEQSMRGGRYRLTGRMLSVARQGAPAAAD